jgi:hypothetical protein
VARQSGMRAAGGGGVADAKSFTEYAHLHGDDGDGQPHVPARDDELECRDHES